MLILCDCHVYYTYRLEEALTEADDVMQFTETALGLQSNNVDEQTAAARKYTQMTDYVTSRIMESTDEPLRKVYVYTVELLPIQQKGGLFAVR